MLLNKFMNLLADKDCEHIVLTNRNYSQKIDLSKKHNVLTTFLNAKVCEISTTINTEGQYSEMWICLDVDFLDLE